MENIANISWAYLQKFGHQSGEFYCLFTYFRSIESLFQIWCMILTTLKFIKWFI